MSKLPMITVPVGRFLIDLPEQASFSFGRHTYNDAGDHICSFEAVGMEDLFASVAAEAHKLETAEKGDKSLLKLYNPGRMTESQTIHYWKGPPDEAEVIWIKSFYWKEGLCAILEAPSEQDPAEIEKVEKSLDASFESLKPRTFSEIPTGPGFCIESAYFQGEPPERPWENASIMVQLKDHPDIHLKFSTATVDAYRGESDSLLFRMNPEHPPHIPESHDLRFRKRQVGPYRGEEVVSRVTELNQTTGHTFQWEAMGPGESATEPALTLQMVTGYGDPAVDSSLPEVDALALWDRILDSIRYRGPLPPGSRKDL